MEKGSYYDLVGGNMKRKETNRIILHHTMSGDVSRDVIDEWHKENGWSGIGYHFVIRYNGDIEIGRQIDEMGAHAKHRNDDSIGIAIVGDFSKNDPTDEQYDSLKKLVNELKTEYKISLVEPHHRMCPGHRFDISKIKNTK